MNDASPDTAARENPPLERSRLRQVAAIAGYGAAFAIFFLTFPQVPNAPHQLSLDNSWVMTYHHFFKSGAQAGEDYVFTYGPLYFLLAKLYDPELFPIHMLGRGLIAAIGSAVFVGFLLRLPALWMRWVMGLVLLYAASQSGTDAPLILLVAIETVLLLRTERLSRAEAIVFAAVCGPVALGKFTLFLLTVVSVGALALSASYRPRERVALLGVPAVFAVSLGVFWVLAGQGMNFVAYLVGSIDISRAYTATMGIEFGGMRFYLASAATVLAVLCVVLRGVHTPDRQTLLLCLYVFTLVVLGWKLGTNRVSMGHLRALFVTDAIAVLALLQGLSIGKQPLRAVASVAVLVLSGAGWMMAPAGANWTVWETAIKPYSNAARAVTLYSNPRAYRDRVDRQFSNIRKAGAYPLMREAVGDAPVDMFPPAQATVFLNGLNYDPRPVFQGYQGGIPKLLAANGAHYTKLDGPEYVAFALGPLDGRFPALEDSQALLALFTHYEFALSEPPYVLLQRRETPQAIDGKPLGTLIGGWDEWFDAPESDGWLLVSMRVHMNPLGRLRGMVLRPPPFSIEFELGDGARHLRHLNAVTASEPFVFQPYLETGLEMFGHPEGLPAREITRFRLTTKPRFQRYFEAELGFEFESIPALR